MTPRWFFKLYKQHRNNPDAWEARIEGLVNGDITEIQQKLKTDIAGFRQSQWTTVHVPNSNEVIYSIQTKNKHLLVADFDVFGFSNPITNEGVNLSNTAKIPTDTSDVDTLLQDMKQTIAEVDKLIAE